MLARQNRHRQFVAVRSQRLYPVINPYFGDLGAVGQAQYVLRATSTSVHEHQVGLGRASTHVDLHVYRIECER